MKIAMPVLVLVLAFAGVCNSAEIQIDISSHAPTNAKTVLRQIEFNVALKMYEKVLIQAHESALERISGPSGNEYSDEAREKWQRRMDEKQKYLAAMTERLRDQIKHYLDEANKEAQEMLPAKREHEKGSQKAEKEKSSPSPNF